MPQAALPIAIGGSLLGGLSAADQARNQRRAAEAASGPQPFERTDTTSPAAWLDPLLRGGGDALWNIFQGRLDSPNMRPTFNQVTSGSYRPGQGAMPQYRDMGGLPGPAPAPTPTQPGERPEGVPRGGSTGPGAGSGFSSDPMQWLGSGDNSNDIFAMLGGGSRDRNQTVNRPLPSGPNGDPTGLPPGMPQPIRGGLPPRMGAFGDVYEEAARNVASGTWSPERAQQRLANWSERTGRDVPQNVSFNHLRPQGSSSSPGPAPSRASGRGGGRVGGGFGGGGGLGGGSAGLRQGLAQMVLDRAAQGRDPSVSAGLNFAQNLLGQQGPQTPGLDRGLHQAAQTYRDIRSPNSPLNALIQRGMGQGFNSTAPQGQELLSGLLSRFNAPVPAGGNRYGSFMDQMFSGPSLYSVG